MATHDLNEVYSLDISPAARKIIDSSQNKMAPILIAVVLADTHCCGGILNVEVHALEEIRKDPHLVEIFPPQQGIRPFPVWVERQALLEFSLPDQILLDFNPFAHPPRLEVKNRRFETPYETS
ncbi:MAG: hypothetical protein ACTSVZ_10780 [Promethearchaeota archaeon]